MKRKALISAGLTAALMLAGVVGGTVAYFTSEAKTDITIEAGQVRVSLVASNFVKKSLGQTMTGTWENGGDATIDGLNVTLQNMTPGDSVEFDLTFSNLSNVEIKYALFYQFGNERTGKQNNAALTYATSKLSRGLEVEITNEDNVEYGALVHISPNSANVVHHVVISLPEEAGNEFQGASALLSFSAYASQFNMPQDSVAYDWESLKAQVEAGSENIMLLNDIEVPISAIASGTLGSREIYQPETIELAANTVFDGNGHSLVLPGYVDASKINFIADKPVLKVLGDNVTIQNLTIDASEIASQGYLIDCNHKAGVKIVDSEFIGDLNSNADQVLRNVDKTITISGVHSSNVFAFIYESSGNVLDGKVTIEDSVIESSAYTINFGTGAAGAELVVKNSILKGWTSYDGLELATFTNVEFAKSSHRSGSYYFNYFRNYDKTIFNECVFDVNEAGGYGFFIDPDGSVRDNPEMTVFNNCQVKDVDGGNVLAALSAANVSRFKEDHDFMCTINGQMMTVTATSANVMEVMELDVANATQEEMETLLSPAPNDESGFLVAEDGIHLAHEGAWRERVADFSAHSFYKYVMSFDTSALPEGYRIRINAGEETGWADVNVYVPKSATAQEVEIKYYQDGEGKLVIEGFLNGTSVQVTNSGQTGNANLICWDVYNILDANDQPVSETVVNANQAKLLSYKEIAG